MVRYVRYIKVIHLLDINVKENGTECGIIYSHAVVT